jgi:nucleotide-binding universal stress UspA family protein
MSETYIVGFDGSDASRAAVRFAERLAGSAGADVVAATVYPAPPVPPGRASPAGTAERAPADARRRAEQLLASLGDGAVACVPVPGESPADGLHRLAAELDASLLAVGVTHHGAAGRLAPGSVGERLLRGAPCPVVVVPSAYEDAAIRTVTVAYDGREDAGRALRAAADLALGLGARLVAVAAFQPSVRPIARGAPVTSYDGLTHRMVRQ